MKKWNTPEVAELNITETANGWDLCWEEGLNTDGKTYFFFSNIGKEKEESGNQGGNPEQGGTGNLS